MGGGTAGGNRGHQRDGGLGFSGGAYNAVVAMGINNDGVIVGWGASFGLLWTPLPLLMVQIDIMPGTFPNTIHLSSKGNVPVAILSTRDFDARTVDPLTVTLRAGPAVPASYVLLKADGKPIVEFEDVNKDRRLDLVVHFDPQSLHVPIGDSSMTLTGATFTRSLAIEGTDSVHVTE